MVDVASVAVAILKWGTTKYHGKAELKDSE